MTGPFCFEHIWALLTTSPKRAKLATHGGLYFGDHMPAGGELVEPYWLRPPELSLRASAYLVRDAAYHAVQTVDASSDSFRDEIVRTGLHVRAAMVKDGLWRALGKPVSASVIVAVETNQGGICGVGDEIDYATYVLGEALEEEGRVLYERSLVLLEKAIRDGFPGWKERGEMVLE